MQVKIPMTAIDTITFDPDTEKNIHKTFTAIELKNGQTIYVTFDITISVIDTETLLLEA